MLIAMCKKSLHMDKCILSVGGERRKERKWDTEKCRQERNNSESEVKSEPHYHNKKEKRGETTQTIIETDFVFSPC